MVLAGWFVIFGQVAFAQQESILPQDSLLQGSLQEKTLGEVMITASKTPLSQRETAKPVQVISRETIEKSAGKDLSQVLNEQAGILVNGAYSNPGQTKGLFVRGAGSEYTLILVDGIPLTDASGVGGAFDLRLLPLQGGIGGRQCFFSAYHGCF